MTLILTALAPRHIVQVSDRRVVWMDAGGRVTRKKDGYVKAVITPSFACSYTGIAELGAGDAAAWLATTLSDHIHETDGGLGSLAAAAQQAVDIPRLKNQELAIVVAGWVQRGSRIVAKLTSLSISYRDELPAFTKESIEISPGRKSCVFPAGQRLQPSELATANQKVEKLCNSGRDTARAIAQVLTEAIRQVARSLDRRDLVSKDVLIASLPRIDLLRNRFVVGVLVEDFWSVTCVPAGESRKERHGGPIIVGHKAVIQALPPEAAPSLRLMTSSNLVGCSTGRSAGLAPLRQGGAA
jgi:hypothetical protein